MTQYLLDTNALLRFFLNDIPSQYIQTKQLLIKAKKNQLNIFIPEVVIFEVYFTLKSFYGFSKELILEKIGILLASNYLEIESKIRFTKAIKLHQQSSKLSFVDCCLIAQAEQKNAQIFTFDKEIQKTKI